MCRSLAEGGRRCPCDSRRMRVRSKADNAARKQISRYKQHIAQLEEANPALQQVIRAQTAVTDPTSDVIKQLRADRSRARRAGDDNAVQVIDAQLAAAQLVIAQHRLAEARAETSPDAPTVPAPRLEPTPANAPQPQTAVEPARTPLGTGAVNDPNQQQSPAARPTVADTARVRDAIYATGASVPKGDWMPLSKLRSMMPADATREEVDAMLKQLSREGKIHLAPEPRKDSLSQDDHDNALRLGGEANHLVSWEAEARVRSSSTPPATPSRRSPIPHDPGQLEASIKAAAEHVHAGDWMPLSELRTKLPADASREDVDALLKQLSRDGKVELAPNPDRKSLTSADRESAVRIGGDENHLIVFKPDWVKGSKPKIDPEEALQRILATGVTADTPQEDLEAARRAPGITREVGQAIVKESFRREEAAREGRSGGIGPVTGDGNLVLNSPQGPLHISMSGRSSKPEVVEDGASNAPQRHTSKSDPAQARQPDRKSRQTQRTKSRQNTGRERAGQRTDSRTVNVVGDGNITITGGRTSQARPQPEPSTVYEAIRAAYQAGVQSARADTQRLADVRARISPRFSREEVDQALLEMGRSQVAYLAPNPNRKDVTEEDHAAAVWIGGDENDLIAFYD